MASRDDRPGNAAELRRQAEEIARDEVSLSLLETLPPAAVRQTLQELRVHQIELEMQNEELRRAQCELEAARERYFDLYDLAPVGYVTLSESGLILEGNLTAATLLGVARGVLVKRAFAQFIHSEDQELYYRHRQQLLATAVPAAAGKTTECELRLRRHDGTAFRARLDATVAPAGDGTRVSRITLHDVSARKQAEDALRESEVSLRAFFDNPGFLQGIVEVIDGDILHIHDNATAAEFFGRTVEEMHQARASQIGVPPETVRLWIAHYEESQRTRLPVIFEYVHGESGNIRHFRVVVTHLGKGSFGPRFTYAVEDFTGYRQAEEAHHAEALRRRTLFEQSADGILFVDPQTARFLEFNTAAHRQLGYSREEFAQLSIRDVEVTEGAEETKERIATVIQSGMARFETRQRTRQGEVRDVHVTAQFLQVGGQSIYQCFWRDITEHKRAEEAVRESEVRLRAITDAVRDAVIMMDPQGLVTYWNPAAQKLLGYSSTEALGQNLHQLLAPVRYHAAHQVALPRFVRTGQGDAVNRTLDLEACHKDGHEIPIEMSLSSLHFQGGWNATAIVRDTTARKQAEAELQKANHRLSAAIAQATELAAQAARASTAKGEFLATMSHEIRTPLNGVIGMTGLLLDSALDAEQRHYAEAVRSSGEVLLGLINDILDFSKIEAGKLDLETLDFDLSSLLDDLAGTLAVRAHGKGLELLCAADPAVPTRLRGDPGRLRQILSNLAGNAIKFTAAGEVVIRAALVEAAGTGVLLRFSVRDTGIGIPAAKRGLLFGKFSQVDASTARQYGGSGLGLAISKQLAELMGGQIGVESVEGQGSEFWFTVRLGRQAGEASAECRPAADLRGVRVLIVDDNASSRELLTLRLAAWGLRPVAQPDGPSALQTLLQAQAQNDPFRVALLDMQMPGMDGDALGRAIRADARLADIRLVMLTSVGARGDARHFQELGFAAYATKPVRHEELRSMLALALQERGAAAPASIVTRHTAREIRDQFAGRQARILVAEDNIVNQQVILGMLKKMGLRADAVANGAEALRALESLPYALVLMDVQMPEMDGLEATRRIRQPASRVCNPQIPVIALTADAMAGDRERFLAAGMNDHVAKPISPQVLAAALERWLPPPPAAAVSAPAPK
jgi:PAS domain S-box-containing protein